MPNRPQKQRRRDYVKQAEQADGQRQARIEHVFCAADDVSSCQQSAGKIDGIERLEEKKSRGRPGKNQRTLQPQTNSDQYVSQIAEEEKILQAELLPVERRPDEQPEGPSDFEPQRQPHGPLLYATSPRVTPAPGQQLNHRGHRGSRRKDWLCSFPSCLCGSLWAPVVTGLRQFLQLPKHHKKSGNTNYQRNLMGLTGVPRMGLVWVTKLFSSVPMKRPLAR